jgi:NADPH-dependent 2,4-dienoyl-CoA reductase/sulfur reductase-like enzyme
MSETIEISFEGAPIAARAGESVAAALAAHGVLSLRTTRDGAERGLFCGMGVCQDCLVEIDGKPEQRACMTKVDRPLRVRRQVHGRLLAPVADGASLAADEIATEKPEVLVIGAGPGGLSAAIAARSAGSPRLSV